MRIVKRFVHTLRSCHTLKPSQIRKLSLSRVTQLNDGDIQYPRLSPQQVTSILRMEEAEFRVNHEAVLRYEHNRLAANTPIEDRHTEGYCNATDGFLFGVFDGHGGTANSQAVSERLFNYIAVKLLNPSLLKQFLERMEGGKQDLNLVKFLRHGSTYFSKSMTDQYKKAIVLYAKEIYESIEDWEKSFCMERVLEDAYVRLDHDFEQEAFHTNPANLEAVTIALAGCCGVTAHIDGPHLHVAHVGDCSALLGYQQSDGTWKGKLLTPTHSCENISERERLLQGRENEKMTMFKDNRVLGILEPTRAFGDFRFKLQRKDLIEQGSKISGMKTDEGSGGIPRSYFDPIQYYYTPPYVTAMPEINYHHLRPMDKFLVLASDGLWNMFPDGPQRVIQLVADHMEGAQTIADFKMPDRDVTLGELKVLLTQRKANISKRAEDMNCATHLIRNALGQTDLGLSHGKLSAMLSLPGNYVRHYRDDITVTVVYFDETYLRDNLEHIVPVPES